MMLILHEYECFLNLTRNVHGFLSCFQFHTNQLSTIIHECKLTFAFYCILK